MSNPQETKQAILKVLAEKGDYATILKHLDTDSKEEKSNRTYKLIEPISAFADLLTQNVEGTFTDKLSTKIDEETKKKLGELSTEIQEAKDTLSNELQSLLGTTKSELVAEHLSRYQEAETALSSKLMQMAVEVTSSKADEMFGPLALEAKLTEDEINDIIDQTALTVESQISSIIGEHIAEQKLTSSQITDFAESVKKLLPAERQVTWNEIAGKPDISQGGTNTNVVRKMIAEIKLNDLSDVTVSSTDPETADGTFWVDIS